MHSLILYSQSNSSRQTFVFDFIFRQIAGLHYEIVHSKEVFASRQGFKIAYTEEFMASDLHIVPHGLLLQCDIKPQTITRSSWRGLPVFFANAGADIPFDLFSAAFYLLSRYEEYLPYTPDPFQRFPHTASLAFREGFLQLPIIDLWLCELKNVLLQKCPALPIKSNSFRLIPTYDIDIAYSYTGKGLIRNSGGALKDLVRGDLQAIRQRRQVLQRNQTDPYDCYDFLDALHERYHLPAVYFLLAGENGPLDKNIPFEAPVMQQLFARLAKRYTVGIHPSYGSHNSPEILREEISKIPGGQSRQHYIRFSLPATYRQLIEAGITDDWSMGYGSINGFRAGTSFSFQWFDVEKDTQTDLRIHPFCFMECNSFFEQKNTAAEALAELKHYLAQVHKVGGELVTIWHNFALGSDPVWKGWREVYAAFLAEYEAILR